MASDFTSGPWDMEGIEKGAVEVAWTGLTGSGATLKLQVQGTGALWYDLDGYLRPVIGASGSLFLPVTTTIVFSKIQLVFSHGSVSAGTLTAVGISYIQRIDNQPIRDS
jgi:hypothetical protein